MDSRTRHVAAGAALLVLTAGCFSSPPGAVETTDGTGTSTSTATATSVSPTSAAATTEAETGDSSTSVAESESSSGPGTSSGNGTRGSDSSSGGETSGSTTAVVDCTDTRVEIEGVCLTPLVVASAHSVLGNDGPFDKLAPCLALPCETDIPLSGGFERQNIVLESIQADFGAATWEICGGPDPDEGPNVWSVGARCVAAEGDIFTASEVFSLDAGSLWCVSVECPEGTQLVGGGGTWGPGFGLTASQPMLDDEEWEVCGRVGGSALDVEVHAYCAVLPLGANTEVFETVEPIDGLSLVCAEATCPVGIAIAGGGDGGALAATFEASQPAEKGDAWRACGRNVAFIGEIRSRVLCYEL